MTDRATAAEFLDNPPTRNAVREHYAREGYALLTGVFDPGAVARMQACWQALADARAKQGKKPHATLLMPHISFPWAAEIVRHGTLLRAVEALLGGKVDLIQSQLMHGVPGTKGFSPHQDNYYNRPDPEDGIIAAWIAVEAVDEENGGVAVFPRSHTGGLARTRHDWWYLLGRTPDILKSVLRLALPHLRRQAADSGVIERFVHASTAGGSGRVVPALEAGSVLFMHGNLVHDSGPNRTQARFRRSLLTNYVRKGTVFSSGLLSGRTPFDVYR